MATAQALTALEEANRIRILVCRWRQETHDLPPQEGIRRVIEILRSDEPGDFGAIRLEYALRAVRKFGPQRVNRILLTALPMCRLAGLKKIRELTVRQREAVAVQLERLL